MGWFRGAPERYVDFRTQERRIGNLETAVAKQAALNKLLLSHIEATSAYIEADISAPSAKDLCKSANELAEALREAIRRPSAKEE
jgi:hypothetical protein